MLSWLMTMKKQECEEISKVTIEASGLKEETIMSLNSLNIGRFMILPKRKVYCISMKGSFRQDMPCKMMELAEKAKVVVLSGVFSLDDLNPKIFNALAFVDFTNSSINPE